MHGRRLGACGTVLLTTAVACGGATQTSESGQGEDGSGDGIMLGDDDDDDDVASGDDGIQPGFRLDVESSMTSAASGNPDASDDGCKKVDFVFVVDSSPSMEDEQDNLIRSFPGFISAIQQNLDLNDFNLMVVDAGRREGQGCDGTLGGGQVTDGSGNTCGLSGASRYASTSQSDLVNVFSCMASRGVDGPRDEQTMDALLAAVGPLNQTGGCNEGFIREDAVLVVTIITDEEDDPSDRPAGGFFGGGDGSCSPVDDDGNSQGGPLEWHDDLVAIKGGDASAVVVLGLMGDCDIGGCPGFSVGMGGTSGAEPAPRLREFVTSFTYGSTGPVCADDYAPFFDAAVGVIRSACDDFGVVG